MGRRFIMIFMICADRYCWVCIEHCNKTCSL